MDTVLNLKAQARDALFWILANAVGICIYLTFEFWISLPRSEEDSFNSFDITFFWFVAELPVLMLFLIVNLIWLNRLISKGRHSRNWQPMIIWSLVGLGWVCAASVFGIAIRILTVIAPILIKRALWHQGSF